MNFRCRTQKGTEHLRSIDKNFTLAQLRQIIEEKFGIPKHAQKLFRGYPPKQITAQDSEIIGNIFQDGDTLTVEQDTTVKSTEKLINNRDHQKSQPENQTFQNTPKTFSKENQQSQKNEPSETNFILTTSSIDDNIQEPSKISPGDGVVVKRAIPDDNSCLFNAVSYVLDRNNTAQNLRNYIATMVLQDPKSYSEAVLGRPNQQYAEWIKHKDHWGGAIELAILSKYYKCEIVAFDVANLHPHCFGEGQGYKQRVFLVYDGIHYDALALAPTPDAPPELDITIFSPNDQLIFDMCFELVCRLNKEHKYTDTTKFEVQCQECSAVLVGEKGIQAHAMATGHTQFVEKNS